MILTRLLKKINSLMTSKWNLKYFYWFSLSNFNFFKICYLPVEKRARKNSLKNFYIFFIEGVTWSLAKFLFITIFYYFFSLHQLQTIECQANLNHDLTFWLYYNILLYNKTKMIFNNKNMKKNMKTDHKSPCQHKKILN